MEFVERLKKRKRWRHVGCGYGRIGGCFLLAMRNNSFSIEDTIQQATH
jgi:hypothetical protein